MTTALTKAYAPDKMALLQSQTTTTPPPVNSHSGIISDVLWKFNCLSRALMLCVGCGDVMCVGACLCTELCA